MFTGIVSHIGRIAEIRDGGTRDLTVASALPLDDLALGASVSHSGICLTVVEKGDGWHRVQAVPETLQRSAAGGWEVGTRLNLERSLRLGDELGGHLVFGHVDGLGEVAALARDGDSWRMTVRLPQALAAYVAEKGSIAIDGASLTVTHAGLSDFAVALIPHTWDHTTLADRRVGDAVNLEVDMLARYVARRLSFADGTFTAGSARHAA